MAGLPALILKTNYSFSGGGIFSDIIEFLQRDKKQVGSTAVTSVPIKLRFPRKDCQLLYLETAKLLHIIFTITVLYF